MWFFSKMITKLNFIFSKFKVFKNIFLVYYLFFFLYDLFLLGCNKPDKKQKFSALDIVESWSKETWSLL